MRILYTTQYMYDVLKHPFGGLEAHVQDLITHLSSDIKIYIFSPDYLRKNYLVTVYHNGKVTQRHFWNYGEKIKFHDVTSKDYQKLLEQVLNYYQIELVHVQNCIDHTYDISVVTQKLNIPTIKSLHDLYDIGGTNFQKDFAERFEMDNLINSPLEDENYRSLWKEKTTTFFKNIDQAIIFSQSTQNIYQQFFNDIHYKLIPHGISVEASNVAEKNFNVRKKIVFCGRISREKGIYELIDVINHVNPKDFEFHIFGMWEPYLLDEKQSLEQKENVSIYGRYNRTQLLTEYLPNIQPHFGFVISDWDETFNYVLSEFMVLGILPIATAKGAIKERIDETKFGLLLEDNKASTIIHILEDILTKDQEWYDKQQHLAKNFTYDTVQSMTDKYEVMYTDLINKKHPIYTETLPQRKSMLKTWIYAIFQPMLIMIAFSPLWQKTKKFRDKIRGINQ